MVKLNADMKPKSSSKKDLINFARDQFRQLVKKNLSIPVQLYHL